MPENTEQLEFVNSLKKEIKMEAKWILLQGILNIRIRNVGFLA